MRPLSLLFALFLAVPAALAQTVPPQGTDATFDVATWNIENFGTGSGTTQRENVAAVIRQADIDLWALQEIVDLSDYSALLADIGQDGYRGVLGPNPGGGGQRLVYIYNEDVVTLLETETILRGNEFNFAGRLPLEILIRATVGGETRQIRVLNIHAKCCGDTQSYNRRVAAAEALKEYTDARIEAGETVLLMGDFNDRLNQSTAGGNSPYREYLADVDDYTIATRDFEFPPVMPTFCSNSTCTSGTPLDHLVFSNDIAQSYVEDSGDRFIELVSAIPSYRATTSDHLPVLAQFTLAYLSDEDAPEAGVAVTVAPNPTTGPASVRFSLEAPASVRVSVLDALGRRVLEHIGAFGAGPHALPVDTARLAPGVYVVRVEADGEVTSRTFVRTR